MSKYIEAIKNNVKHCAFKVREASETTLDENKFAEYFGGVPTWHLKFTLNEPCSVIRRELAKLEKQGLVISFVRGGNNKFWWPVGFFAELRGGK